MLRTLSSWKPDNEKLLETFRGKREKEITFVFIMVESAPCEDLVQTYK